MLFIQSTKNKLSFLTKLKIAFASGLLHIELKFSISFAMLSFPYFVLELVLYCLNNVWCLMESLACCRMVPENKEIVLHKNMKRKRKRTQVNLGKHLQSK